MKAGFTLSIAAHIIALVILLVSFSAPPLPENQQTEEVPISLVPMSDVLALQKGEAEAAKKQKAAQKPTQKPEVKPDAENAGNAKIDTPLPEKPKLKERQVNAPPPSKGEEQGKTELTKPEQPAPPPQAETPPKPAEEKPAPTQPEPRPAEPPEPTPAEPSLNAPADDIGDLLNTDAPEQRPEPPKPEKPQPKPAAPKAEEKPQPAEPEAPDLAAAQVPLPMARPAEPRPEPKKGEKDGAGAADSRNALIDRTKTSGGGAKRSEAEAAFGANKNIGDNNAELQQTLNNIIGSCVARNWDIGVIQGSNAYDLRVQVHFRLKQDGSLDGTPELTPAGGDAKDQEVISRQAQAALVKCAPFKLPADKYDQWHDVTINMRAFPN